MLLKIFAVKKSKVGIGRGHMDIWWVFFNGYFCSTFCIQIEKNVRSKENIH